MDIVLQKFKTRCFIFSQQLLSKRHGFDRIDRIALLAVFVVALINYISFPERRKFQIPAELYAYSPAILPYKEFFFPTRDVQILIQGIEHSPATFTLPTSGQIFCFVETSTKYYKDRVPSVASTWLPRCDHGRFFTKTHLPYPDIAYSTVYRNLRDTYDDLFRKSIFSLYYSYTSISKHFDWYLKTDDDTFVAMDHLREYLNTLNPAEPLYLGYRLAPFMNNGYNSGGSGYILSNAAMRMFVEQLYHNVRLCPYDRGEDRGMGRCLESVGITPSDTRDDQELNRFMPFRPAEIPIIGSKWHYFPLKYPFISKKFVTLHRVPPEMMISLDKSLYSENGEPTFNVTDFFNY
ncbi:N-acetylgalactosaminide beta-1,3-galactosyltransferase [Caenorhabditis elegans]|uniref:N-acetylgalactosaminide beta-1,3-galactosyltransferase n=1 Tax=Caenorhabditis elegans TaxID=6239 RepID=O16535_CAEEL|nr:Glycoprotein-N-acetylgalactosamine 3-beta-galactosyltransferase 1 [Caenorhabditis elegans]CCD64792.1 Glycoprotein-N-acetylgalactosamine 3-beta-galactosyltransferase 1 [Caenorhabditis elegans]|eukprot:NP_494669.1 Glycoprotein-N-acetylgalactosamine 3-beta-galactosyltransferase 1 [Caenorhabditis elegans]